MKRILGIAAFFIVFSIAGQAQTLKFGHINSDELIRALPEFDSANVKLEKFQTELINALELMQVELNNKSDAYNKDSKILTEVVKQVKEQELIDLNRRLQEFQQSAQQQLTDRQSELFQPIMAKVDKAIKDVGKENGFIYILTIGQGSSLVYFDETKSINVMTLAKAKLGVK
jgi:outer membrane protein